MTVELVLINNEGGNDTEQISSFSNIFEPTSKIKATFPDTSWDVDELTENCHGELRSADGNIFFLVFRNKDAVNEKRKYGCFVTTSGGTNPPIAALQRLCSEQNFSLYTLNNFTFVDFANPILLTILFNPLNEEDLSYSSESFDEKLKVFLPDSKEFGNYNFFKKQLLNRRIRLNFVHYNPGILAKVSSQILVDNKKLVLYTVAILVSFLTYSLVTKNYPNFWVLAAFFVANSIFARLKSANRLILVFLAILISSATLILDINWLASSVTFLICVLTSTTYTGYYEAMKFAALTSEETFFNLLDIGAITSILDDETKMKYSVFRKPLER
ncbi:hypothetical protein [Desertivirga brevis]|uniref:hypothetical protein n=1 Tax=Desertivirga brevis TaxID=2810310 RepID=UPI001A96EB4F|nr:hypothetical protein [Pedobacter sp. SYSU D00873]